MKTRATYSFGDTHSWHRRHFLSVASIAMATTIAGICDHQSIANETTIPNDLDIIDCHTHFYDPNRPGGIPWPEKGSSLYRTVLPKHLRALPQFRRVTGTIIVEASSNVEDNAWLLEIAKDDPFILGIVGRIDADEAGFERHLDRFASNQLFRGVRMNEPDVRSQLAKKELHRFSSLAKRDLGLDMNGGPEMPTLAAQLADHFPDLRIVINHIGNVEITSDPPPREWRQAIEKAAQHENVFCKISALVEGASRNGMKAPKELDFYRPTLDVVWNAFGDERVIYGSNWPVSEQAADYATLQEIVLSYASERGNAALQKFCALNSKRAYRWQERPGR